MIRNYYTESASCRFRVMGVHVYAQVISLRALSRRPRFLGGDHLWRSGPCSRCEV